MYIYFVIEPIKPLTNHTHPHRAARTILRELLHPFVPAGNFHSHVRIFGNCRMIHHSLASAAAAAAVVPACLWSAKNTIILAFHRFSRARAHIPRMGMVGRPRKNNHRIEIVNLCCCIHEIGLSVPHPNRVRNEFRTYYCLPWLGPSAAAAVSLLAANNAAKITDAPEVKL